MNYNIRKATVSDAAAIAYIKYQSWRDTYRGIIADSYLDAMDEAEIAATWQKILSPENTRSATHVICNEQGLVLGFISHGRSRERKYNADGEILALYLLNAYRGEGLGALLFHHAIKELNDGGIHSYFVLVLAQNRALNFYRRLGPQEEYPEKVTIDNIEYDEIALVWQASLAP